MLVCFLLFLLAGSTGKAEAVPAFPGLVELRQPDGSAFLARQWGDERLHGWETADGYTIVKDEASGCWCYARTDERGSLLSTGVRADRTLILSSGSLSGAADPAATADPAAAAAVYASGLPYSENSGQASSAVTRAVYRDNLTGAARLVFPAGKEVCLDVTPAAFPPEAEALTFVVTPVAAGTIRCLLCRLPGHRRGGAAGAGTPGPARRRN